MHRDLLSKIEALPKDERRDMSDMLYLLYGTVDFNKERLDEIVSKLRTILDEHTQETMQIITDNEGVNRAGTDTI